MFNLDDKLEKFFKDAKDDSLELRLFLYFDIESKEVIIPRLDFKPKYKKTKVLKKSSWKKGTRKGSQTKGLF